MTKQIPTETLRRPFKRIKNLRLSLILLTPFLFIGSPAFSQKSKTEPATQEDIYLYRGIGSSYVCNARTAGVEFPKAVGIAAATYTQLLKGRHDGKIKQTGKKKLTNKQLFAGAEFQVLTGAIQYCPDSVPNDIKKKVEEAIKKENAKKKKKR